MCIGWIISSSSETLWLRVVILGLIAVIAFSSRLFSVIRFESVIHEFDPFNYRTTRKLVADGFYEFWNWFDERSWYPLGRVVGGTVYPGLMVTAGVIHKVLHSINFPVDIRNICVFLAPVFSTLTSLAVYLLTSEVATTSAGLLAAIFVGIAPGYISRSELPFFLLMFTFYLWIKAVKLGSAFYGALAALFYFYMVAAWGGYVFITNLIPLHVFALVLMGRFNSRIYVAYCSWYALGTIASMQVPFVGFQPVRTSEHMAALGIFGLLQIIAFVELLRSHISGSQFQLLFKALVVTLFVLMFAALVGLTFAGVVAPWTGRFYSLWDTGYAKKHIPIIASVSEHQPTAWASFFFDLQALVWLFPAGVYFCFQELRDEHVFVILYSVTASYFAGVMVRLMLTLTPIVCVAAAMAVSKLLDTYFKSHPVEESGSAASSSDATSASSSSGKSKSDKAKAASTPVAKSKTNAIRGIELKVIVGIPMAVIMIIFAWHCTWVTSNAYSSPSIVLASQARDGSQVIIDDFREAYYWLRKNTHPDDRVMSWWDYGYQIAGMANRTTLVDNNTWNNTHIATVGKAMSCSEDVAYEVMKKLDVDYVLVIFGGLIGYSGDDINKFLWMIRIAEGVYPDDVTESKFFTERGEYRVDDQATPTMRNSIMYKMSYYRFQELFGGQQAVDRVRGTPITSKPIKLHTLEEAYTTENWIVRLYKVKKEDNLGRKLKESKATKRRSGSRVGGKRKTKSQK
ncbi:Oligosaccharyl transferase STT3 subunit-domain-containing protein [Paraphysoderma sedebokerense]|nr:Oligosaccharyl transferase STT3 subunit-domain-containing protein [Paraphysoderma sedebokerense]